MKIYMRVDDLDGYLDRAEPRRRAILRLVARDELAAGEIAAAFDVTRTAVGQHLTVLKDAGLLAERRDGTRRRARAHQGHRAGPPARPPAAAARPEAGI